MKSFEQWRIEAQLKRFNALSVETLKGMMGEKCIAYDRLMEEFGCGGNLAAVISLRVYRVAQQCNQIAARLKEIDPGFPTSWVPLPEGD